MIYNSILAVEHLNTLTDSEGRPTAHINTIFNKVIQLEEAGIEQIWIFDSPQPNEIKRVALEQRSKRREESARKNYKNNDKVQFKLTGAVVEEIQFLLKQMGVMYMVAPPGVEAEQYGACLSKGSNRFCQYMISGDSDVLCFGGNLLRISSRKSDTGKKKETIYKVYELDDVLHELNFNYDQFLQMCVLMGTDFAQGTEGIGPARVVEKVRKDEYPLSPRQEKAIEYYKSDITEKIGNAEIVEEPYNLEGLISFLKERSFSEERVRGRLKKYKVS